MSTVFDVALIVGNFSCAKSICPKRIRADVKIAFFVIFFLLNDLNFKNAIGGHAA
jgi:hypothetical protein